MIPVNSLDLAVIDIFISYLVSKLIDCSVGLLITDDSSYSKGWKKARQNALSFQKILVQEVDRLRKEVTNKNIRQKIKSALEDPDFLSLLRNAVNISSNTDNEEKHKILARIISERLGADSESLLSLTSRLACNTVEHLTPLQLRFLGLIALVSYIPRPPLSHDTPLEFTQGIVKWMTWQLGLHGGVVCLRKIDYDHLQSVSCIELIPNQSNLIRTLNPFEYHDYDAPFHEFIHNVPDGMILNQLWHEGMGNVQLTTTGRLIGIYVHDELSQTRTLLDW